jgi:uncharacterized repeat protein (TIGR03803 family)
MSRVQLQSSTRPPRMPHIAFLASLLLLGLPFANAAEQFQVLHTFTDRADGADPYAGMIIDAKGNLYGTTNQGGKSGSCYPEFSGCGTVFELSPSKSGWKFKTLYTFQGGQDGQGPYGEVMFGPDGSLYGTTVNGGNPTCPSGCGSIFSLKPAKKTWTETVLYDFQGDTDAYYPTGNLAMDSSGNLYGTTYIGGADGPGTVYELTNSGGTWTESIVWSFTAQADGANPYSGVVIGSGGTLFTTTTSGGINLSGTVDELTKSGNTWSEQTLYEFEGNDTTGADPFAGLLLDPSGALIGATEYGGTHKGGTVFRLTPSGGEWDIAPVYSLRAKSCCNGPAANLIMDAAGNLYGTTQGNPGVNYGTVFKLTLKDDRWVIKVLHTFTGGSDGGTPMGALVLDSSGNIYGTTLLGGLQNQEGGYGVVFEITP